MKFSVAVLLAFYSLSGFCQDTTCYSEYKRIRDRYLGMDNYKLELRYSMKGGETGDKPVVKMATITKSGTNLRCILGDMETIATSSHLVTIFRDKKMMVISKPQKEREELLTGMTAALFDGFTKDMKCQALAGGMGQISFTVNGVMVDKANITYFKNDARMKMVEIKYLDGYGYSVEDGAVPVSISVEYLSEKNNVSFSSGDFDLDKYYVQKNGKYIVTSAYQSYQLIDLSGEFN